MTNIFRQSKDSDEKKPTRWYSTKQEKAVAKSVDGKRQPNSGATMFMPGDIVTEDWQLECKTCEKSQKSFSIKKDWLVKNKEESVLSGKQYTALVFNFGPDEDNYAIVDLQTFNLMKEALAIVESQNNV